LRCFEYIIVFVVGSSLLLHSVYLLKNKYNASLYTGIYIGYWYWQDPIVLGIG